MSSSNTNRPGIELPAGYILQNRYRVTRLLGKGGMGAVYEALDERLDATIAIKETFSTDDQLRKQFAREARMLASLNHPSLPRVSDYFTEGERAFLVMQFVEGVDLARIIAQQPGPFPLESVVAWADQLLDALIYLHTRDRQIIHRDIKPHNLKLTPEGQIALLDFGLAKAQQLRDVGATSSAAIYGYTKQYAPLEQIQDSAIGPQSDIYALGATLYHLLTGVKPPDALSRASALIQGQPDPLRPANEVHWAIGSEISGILNRAMAQNAADRYASASEFRDALRCVGRTRITRSTDVRANADHEDQTTQFRPPAERSASASGPIFGAPATKEWNYKVSAIAAALILLIAAAAVFFLRSNEQTDSAPVTAAEPNSLPDSTVKASKATRPATQKVDNGGLSMRVANVDGAADEVSKSIITTRTPSGSAATATGRLEPTPAQAATRSQKEPGRSLKAPSIQFPNGDQPRDFTPPVPSRTAVLEQYVPSANSAADNSHPVQPTEAREPQILRARDGTQIVKFPDGSTRVYRPGERGLRTADAPR